MFMKIHAPWKVITRYAEVMNMKMPIKVRTVYFERVLQTNIGYQFVIIMCLFQRFLSISVKAWVSYCYLITHFCKFAFNKHLERSCIICSTRKVKRSLQ